MATIATIRRPDTRDSRLRKGLDDYFATLGQGMNAYLERLSRQDQIDRLQALSDEDLLKLGIRRERIAHHVFADRFVF